MGLFQFSRKKRAAARDFQPQPKQNGAEQTFILEPMLTPSGLLDSPDTAHDFHALELSHPTTEIEANPFPAIDHAVPSLGTSHSASAISNSSITPVPFVFEPDPTSAHTIPPLDSNQPLFSTVGADLAPISMTSGIFTVGLSGQVSVDYLFDGGSYQGEVAIFSLQGMKHLEPGSTAFIQETARRALSETHLGHVVIHDATEGAKFSAKLLWEGDFNKGKYLGEHTVEMEANSQFAVMLVPKGTVQDIFKNPDSQGATRPLFSIVTANPINGLQFNQIGDVTGDGHTFAFEDQRIDAKSDRDYNDLVFHVSGATGHATSLDNLINPQRDWRTTETGKSLVDYAHAQDAVDAVATPIQSTPDSHSTVTDSSIDHVTPPDSSTHSISTAPAASDPANSTSQHLDTTAPGETTQTTSNTQLDSTTVQLTTTDPVQPGEIHNPVNFENSATQPDVGSSLLTTIQSHPDSGNTSIQSNISTSQPTTIIGVIDTGLYTHSTTIDYSQIQLGHDYVEGDADPTSVGEVGVQHGTQVVELIQSTQTKGAVGVQAATPIWVSKVGRQEQWADALVEFVNHAEATGQSHAVVNLSFDLTQQQPDGSVTTRFELTPHETAVLQYAQDHHVVIVAAAGNQNGAISALGQASQQFDNIVTVGASDGADRAAYSSFGSGLVLLAPGGTVEHPIIAPLTDSNETIVGASASTAQVTAAVTLVWQANADLSYQQVIDILKQTATDVQLPGWDTETGFGILNLVAAVEVAKQTIPQAIQSVISGGTDLNSSTSSSSTISTDLSNPNDPAQAGTINNSASGTTQPLTSFIALRLADATTPGSVTAVAIPPLGSRVIQTGILWRSATTGANTIWTLNNSVLVDQTPIPTPVVSDPDWKIIGSGDFNHDGNPDILWRNDRTGEDAVWLMNGTQFQSGYYLPSAPDTTWRIVGSGDFNSDGNPDLLWRNDTTGQLVIWFIDASGKNTASSAYLSSNPGTAWRVQGVADFNGDGKPDILWRNSQTGENAIWLMNGSQVQQGIYINSVADLNWQIQGAADFNSDGKPDILWRNTATGENAVWFMTGTTFQTSIYLPSLPVSQQWQAALPFPITEYAPSVAAVLQNDTGSSSTDRVTANPTILGQISTQRPISVLSAKFSSATQWVDVTASLQSGNSFILTAQQLQQLNGGKALSDGSYTLQLQAKDNHNNLSTISTVTFTLDTQSPQAPQALQILTPYTQPTLTGQAEPDSTIRISDGNQFIGQTTTKPDGSWQLALQAPLSLTTHSFTATSTDAAGNTSNSSSALIFTPIPKPAVPTQVKLSPNNDTGISNSDNITRMTTPTMTGVTSPNAIVTLSNAQGQQTGQGQADSLGAWQITTNALGDGTQTITAIASNEAGKSTASSPLILTIDTQAPTAPQNLQLSNPYTTPTLSGRAEPNSRITVSDNNQVIGTAISDQAGAWQLTLSAPLSAQPHNFTATSTDTAGNTSASSSGLGFTPVAIPITPTQLELSADTDTGLSNADGVTQSATPTVMGVTSPNAIVTLFNTQGQQIGQGRADGAGAWQITTSTLSGAQAISAIASNEAGSSPASAPLSITIDQQAPALPQILQVSTPNTIPIMTGFAEPGSTVTVSENNQVVGTAISDQSGAWQLSLSQPLSQTTHNFAATATDAAGNLSASATLSYTPVARPLAPTQLALSPTSDTGISNSDNITSITTPTVTGKAAPNASVNIYSNGKAITQTQADNLGSWSITTDTLPDGKYALTATVSNAADESLASTPLDLTIDTTAPTVLPFQIESPYSTPILKGHVEPNSAVSISDGITTWQTQADPNGNWQLVLPTLSPGAHYNFTATATDLSGNVSLPISLTFTLTPPDAPTLQLDPDSDTGFSHSDGITQISNPTITGTAAPGATINLYSGNPLLGYDNVLVGTTQANDQGNWTIQTSLLPNIPQVLTATATTFTGTSSASAPLNLLIDSQPPAKPSAQLLKDISPLTLIGTTEAGSTIQIVDENDIDVTPSQVTINSDGSWQASLPGSLTESHRWQILAVDAAGNLSQPTIVGTLKAPQALTLVTDSDSGSSQADRITKVTTPTVTGTAKAGTTIQLLSGNAIVGTTTAGDDGTWSITPTALAEGTHSLTAVASDDIAQSSASAALNFTIDTTPPSAQLIDLPDGITWFPDQPLAGLATDASNQAVLVSYVIDGQAIGEFSTPSGASFDQSLSSFLSTCEPGSLHTLSVIATDTAGNAQTLPDLRFMAPPKLEVTDDDPPYGEPDSNNDPSGGSGSGGSGGGGQNLLNWASLSGPGPRVSYTPPPTFQELSPGSPDPDPDEDMNGCGYHFTYINADDSLNKIDEFIDEGIDNLGDYTRKGYALSQYEEILNHIAEHVYEGQFFSGMSQVMYGLFTNPNDLCSSSDWIGDNGLSVNANADLQSMKLRVYQAEVVAAVNQVLKQQTGQDLTDDPEQVTQPLLDLSFIYAGLNPNPDPVREQADDPDNVIAQQAKNEDFLDALWQAKGGDTQRYDDGVAALGHLMQGIDPQNQPKALKLISNLLKTAVLVAPLGGKDGAIHQAQFLRELVGLAIDYVKANPKAFGSTTAQPNECFLDTILREGDSQNALDAMGQFFGGSNGKADPLKLVQFERKMIGVVKGSDKLKEMMNSGPQFLGSLLNLSSVYAQLDPQPPASGDDPQLFLDSLWRSNDTSKAISELETFLQDSPKPADLFSFSSKLLTAYKAVPQLRSQLNQVPTIDTALQIATGFARSQEVSVPDYSSGFLLDLWNANTPQQIKLAASNLQSLLSEQNDIAYDDDRSTSGTLVASNGLPVIVIPRTPPSYSGDPNTYTPWYEVVIDPLTENLGLKNLSDGVVISEISEDNRFFVRFRSDGPLYSDYRVLRKDGTVEPPFSDPPYRTEDVLLYRGDKLLYPFPFPSSSSQEPSSNQDNSFTDGDSITIEEATKLSEGLAGIENTELSGLGPVVKATVKQLLTWVSEFAGGAIYQYLKDISAPADLVLTALNPFQKYLDESAEKSAPPSPAFTAGRTLGDGAAIISGFLEFIAGGGIAAGSGALCLTGIGCLAGAPSVIAGTAIAGTGLMTTDVSVTRLLEHLNVLFSKGTGNSGEINWSPQSTPTFGHTFSRHGAGSKKTQKLQGRAARTKDSQGQWLDDKAAAELLKSKWSEMTDEPLEFEIPPGLGQVIMPDGSIVPTTWARAVPRPGGVYKTAYPILKP